MDPDLSDSDRALGMADLLQQHHPAAEYHSWHPGASADWHTIASADTWQHKLQLLRKKHDLNAGLERPFGMPPLFFRCGEKL